MIYRIVNIIVYVVSVLLAMLALSCFKYEEWIKRSKIKEFYIFYVMASIALGYLFASFILNFGTLSFYA